MKAKKLLALALAALLCLGLLAGCGGGNAGNSGADSGSSAAASGEPITFPLPEKKTLTVWMPFLSGDPKLGLVTWNDSLAVQAWEEATNVHIEWKTPPYGQEQDQFNLMITSGEYPDIIFSAGQYYTGGLDKAIDDGVLIDMAPYMDNQLKDYKELISRDKIVFNDSKTDQGRFAGVWMINTPDQGPWYGMVMRQDWLDELGLPTPVTYDDWHDTLLAFKEHYGAKSPIWLNYHAGDIFSVFSAGYGVSTLGSSGNGFINVGGTVKYSPMEDGYREYITMMHQWYEEGLIDPDFYSDVSNVYVPPDDIWGAGQAGAWPDMYSLIDIRPAMTAEEGINVVAVPAPVKNAGDQLHLRQYNFSRGTNCASITTACKDPELAAAWLNLGSIMEYSNLAYYGVEGVTYEMVDGQPTFTDYMLNGANPDGLNSRDAMTKYTWRAPGMYRWDRELQTVGPKGKAAINEIWVSNADGDYMMPNITMTSDEGTEYARIMGDVTTYVEEMTTKFILGSESLDGWDNYISTLKSMGVEDAIKLQQAALDRFNAR